MSYRPITDLWILGRPKVKYYGAYPGGFLSRARALLGVRPEDPVLHVCSGKVREYPYAGVGPNDMTLDGNAALAPDFVIDVTTDAPLPPGFAAILTDPPYTAEDALHYEGGLPFPSSSALMKKCLEAVAVGSRVGMLHYEWPACPAFAREVAVVGVTTGRRQRMRHFVVMEKIEPKQETADEREE